jgi:transcriptional regulator with XRE-family HTH domain
MVDDPPGATVSRRLAQNLRRLRIARRLSLSELARATAMSKANLSSIESGGANPTIDTLASLACALQISLTELLEAAPAPELRIVRGQREPAAERVLSANGPTIAELALDARELREETPGPSGSRAHVYVMQGRVIAGPVERVSELVRGDYAEFAADVPHGLETTGTAARVLRIITASGS